MWIKIKVSFCVGSGEKFWHTSILQWKNDGCVKWMGWGTKRNPFERTRSFSSVMALIYYEHCEDVYVTMNGIQISFFFGFHQCWGVCYTGFIEFYFFFCFGRHLSRIVLEFFLLLHKSQKMKNQLKLITGVKNRAAIHRRSARKIENTNRCIEVRRWKEAKKRERILNTGNHMPLRTER